MTNVLGQSKDIYAIDHHSILEQAVFLDTSKTLQNSSSAAVLGLAGCSLYFSLPSANLGNDESGSCVSVLDKDCVRDFTKVAVDAATAISRNADPTLTTSQACANISNSMQKVPKSCSRFQQDGSKSIGKGLLAYSSKSTIHHRTILPLNLSPPSQPKSQNCSGFSVSDQPVPVNIFSQSYAFPNAANYTLYDQFVRSTTPMLLAFFSNATSGVQYSEPFADAHLVCSAPRNAQPDPRVADFLARNKQYAQTHKPIPTLESQANDPPSPAIIVITCFDVRIQPQQFLQITDPTESFILSNAGGRVDADTLRSLMVLDNVKGIKSVMVIHHTDCGLTHATDASLKEKLKKTVPELEAEIEKLGPLGEIKE
ncbi:uncharacterized protein KY384_004316 [Bacidia gigantensis]|uniref:uncharacterized protein n=1 Tax=Bacidia gigantensis TaxID=2732470 RepID=UPI001D044146|nr:uncharacterized protein KY384_004316 [Bacidia gigantensis]KAG8530959.1 hypothetical protein KY384_004316 [Bacidia gigantensis]